MMVTISLDQSNNHHPMKHMVDVLIIPNRLTHIYDKCFFGGLDTFIAYKIDITLTSHQLLLKAIDQLVND
jgi:hypothetical protein